MSDIDISSLNKADVLRVLYNNAKTQGMGIIHYTPEDMTCEEAKSILNGGETYFDYLKGRVMKVKLEGDILETGLYNRDNGFGAAEKAIAEI